MAPGVQRCMYCGDSQGSSIDHFEPLSLAPLKAFAWMNHLLACTHCNSNHKRDRFPVDAEGHCLLVDPTSEDPALHLQLVLRTGEYQARTPKGQATIEVFGLARPSLERGRAKAFVRCRSMLRDLGGLIEAGEDDEAMEVAESLRVQPFADVLHAMQTVQDRPGAAVVLGARELESLRWLTVLLA
ncbi:HNH endonuclease [Streptacidiphilus sp. PB12-B1b]|nr:HNH endonuclease [Streptacidiphilus sp. PB12-B1b]